MTSHVEEFPKVLIPSQEAILLTQESIQPSQEPIYPSQEPITPSQEPIQSSQELITLSQESDTPRKYIFNDIDYTDYANDFLEDPHLYHDLIASYSDELDTLLEIRANNILFDKAYLYVDSTVHPCNNDSTYDNIVEWVKATTGDAYSPEYIFTNVYMGEDNTPLWKILEIAQLEEFPNKPVKQINIISYEVNNFPMHFILLILSIYFGIFIGTLINANILLIH